MNEDFREKFDIVSCRHHKEAQYDWTYFGAYGNLSWLQLQKLFE